ncbi:MAG: hypothetical protein M3126_02415 [Candidatus Eremiobacteraeota bacterium]|nr:hypothetical protein [Candidatus Eremiobacteraeota bacterium]
MRLFRTFFLARRNLAGVLPLLRDSRVPISLKVTAAGLALLVFTPVNFLGYIPLVGFFDDAALLILIATWFSRAAVKHVERNVTGSLATQLANR